MVLCISGHTNKRTAQTYPLVFFSNKRPNNRGGGGGGGGRHKILMKKNSRKYFLLGQILSVFSSFLGTTSAIKTSDNFPEPRARFAEVQIFVIFSSLSGFLNFLTLTIQLGPLEVLPSKILLKFKFRFFLPAALTICSGRHKVNWLFFNQKIASRFFWF